MKKAYWVACYRKIADPEALKKYSVLAGPAIEAAGGRFVLRGLAAESHEAGIIQRTVVVEFENLEKARAAYRTDAYRNALRAMAGSVERDFRIIEEI
jgi:uncharacterized protein (DUF1330 family)